MAGVSSLLARHMDANFGTQSLVVTRKALDRYRLTDYGQVWDCGPTEFAVRSVLAAGRFDVVHFHDFDRVVRAVKLLYSKPVVLEYHSFRFGGQWAVRRRFWRHADRLLVSTPNLLEGAPPEAALLPNPVEAVRPQGVVSEGGTAIYFIKHDRDGRALETARQRAAGMGLQLVVQDVRTTAVAHAEVFRLLSAHEYCVDQQYIPALSKTALEALAIGTKVVKWDGQVVEGLPPEHLPQNVVARLYRVYSELLAR